MCFKHNCSGLVLVRTAFVLIVVVYLVEGISDGLPLDTSTVSCM